jgi:hypothetical protein
MPSEDAFWAALERWRAEHPPPPPRPPYIPSGPTPGMSVVEAAQAERVRLRAMGHVHVVGERLDGRVVVRVDRESGETFQCFADLDDPQDVCNAVDFALRRRVERERQVAAERVEQLRRRARRAEDEADHRRRVDAEIARHAAAHDRRLGRALRQWRHTDGALFEAIEEAS